MSTFDNRCSAWVFLQVGCSFNADINVVFTGDEAGFLDSCCLCAKLHCGEALLLSAARTLSHGPGAVISNGESECNP